MKTIFLDGNVQENINDIFEMIYKELNDNYILGKNMDALWDFLSTDVERPFSIYWKNFIFLKKNILKSILK